MRFPSIVVLVLLTAACARPEIIPTTNAAVEATRQELQDLERRVHEVMVVQHRVEQRLRARPNPTLDRAAVRACLRERTCVTISHPDAAVFDPSFTNERVIGILACAPEGGVWIYRYYYGGEVYGFSERAPRYDIRAKRDEGGVVAAWIARQLPIFRIEARERDRLRRARTSYTPPRMGRCFPITARAGRLGRYALTTAP